MDCQDSTQQQAVAEIAEDKALITQAKQLMQKMKRLKDLLLIKQGAGRRYLQQTQPDIEQLKKIEQVILSNYQGKKPSLKKCNKGNLVQAMHRKGIA